MIGTEFGWMQFAGAVIDVTHPPPSELVMLDQFEDGHTVARRAEGPLIGGTSLVSDSFLGEPNLIPEAKKVTGHRLWVDVAGWILLIGGVFCLLIAELFLVQSAYYSFGEFAARWWLAFSLLVPTVSMAATTGVVTIQAFTAFRARTTGSSFLKHSAVCFGIGVIELISAVVIAVISIIALAAARSSFRRFTFTDIASPARYLASSRIVWVGPPTPIRPSLGYASARWHCCVGLPTPVSG